MKTFLLFISFIFFLNFSLEILPNWSLTASAINLLPNSGTVTYTLVDRDMYSMKVKLNKTITKSGDEITQKNYLSINGGEAFVVDFENIESFYHLNGIDIICPKGKSHPYDATNKKYFQPDNFEEKGQWDLKCYKHQTNYFLAFYLMNGEKHLFFSTSQYESREFDWKNTALYNIEELYDFKLDNGETCGNNRYKMGALILKDNYLKLKSFMSEFHCHSETDNLVYIFDSENVNPVTMDIIEVKQYTQAYFKNYSDEFYFYTYNDISDFTSGYSNVTTNNYHSIGNVQVKINSKSPFEFIDEAQILEMNFLLYNKYIYYTIKNKITGEIYHGLYDVKEDKIMFNTNEEITTFIPHSPYSILAISDNNVYKICALKDGNNCIEECPSNEIIIRDSDGNKCGTSCDNNKYLFIPDNVCITDCDSSMYGANSDKKCGLCEDLDNSKPYKLKGSLDCLFDIPALAEEYDTNLHLLRCKNGYIEEGNNCIPHCYPTCLTCSDYSESYEDHKCLTCNDSYYFENEKCIKKIPTTIPTTIQTTIPLKIPSTIQIPIPTTIHTKIATTITTTIPTTIFIPILTTILTTIPFKNPTTIQETTAKSFITTIPTTNPTTIQTTISTTIPTTIISVIPTTILTTIPTTIPLIECLQEKCLTCNSPSERLGLCLSCNEGYKKINYVSVFPEYVDCLKENDPKLKKFYFNETFNEYRPCFKNCLTS